MQPSPPTWRSCWKVHLLHHSGFANDCQIEISFVDSGAIEKEGMEATLSKAAGGGAIDAILIPGGFGDRGTEGKIEAVRFARERRIPFLGICLGLQLLFTESEENGLHQGLDIIPGRVRRFRLPADHKVPQIGWNSVQVEPSSRMLAGIPSGSHIWEGGVC